MTRNNPQDRSPTVKQRFFTKHKAFVCSAGLPGARENDLFHHSVYIINVRIIMKRILSAILTLSMLVGMVVCIHADEQSSWAKNEVEAAINEGLVPEYIQKNWTSPISRGQVSEMFVRLLEKATGKTVDAIITEKGARIDEGKFEDTDDSNVYAANALGIINGTSSSKFSPDGTLKRAQIAALINRVAKVTGVETDGYTHQFEDITDNYSWVDTELGWPSTVGIINGVSSTRFSPGGDLTTEQAILITYRAYKVLTSNVLTLYVSADGSGNSADGSREKPYAGIEEAKNAIRSMDKTGYTGIDVVLLGGIYHISNTIEFTEEDAGTKECPIRYLGENGATLSGGIMFDSSEFEKAGGDLLTLFPEEARDKLYMLDLGKFGYTGDDIESMLLQHKYYNAIGIINVNGAQMDLARYPNADEGWINIESGYFLDKDGNYTENDGNDGGEDCAVQTVIKYGEEHKERVLSWSNRDDLFVRGFYKFIWCRDDTEVTKLYEDSDTMLLPFSGGYFPVPGGLLFFYNIPEELDVPGEYYVDHNAILYYYPTEDFETSTFTMPQLEGPFVKILNADYLTFENITFETTKGDGIYFTADHLAIRNCTIRDIYHNAIIGEGNEIVLENNEVTEVGEDAINISGGDEATLTPSNNLIINNYVHKWSTRDTMCWGINVDGCGSTVSHNEVGDSSDLGVCASGPMHLVEYNYIYKTNQFFCDGGALNTHGNGYGTVLRYNVIEDTGFETELDIVGVAGIISDGTSGNTIYGNIIYNTTGHSLLMAGGHGGRDTHIYNNLCIKPGREGYELNCPTIADDIRNNEKVVHDIPEFLLSDIWQEKFPELKGIHGTFDPETYESDPYFIYAPVNDMIYDNYLFLDKSYSNHLERFKNRAGNTQMIESGYLLFSEETIETFSQYGGNMTIYNSKRDKNHITLLEALNTANDSVGIIMTEEQLAMVGRAGIDYSIGEILVK